MAAVHCICRRRLADVAALRREISRNRNKQPAPLPGRKCWLLALFENISNVFVPVGAAGKICAASLTRASSTLIVATAPARGMAAVMANHVMASAGGGGVAACVLAREVNNQRNCRVLSSRVFREGRSMKINCRLAISRRGDILKVIFGVVEEIRARYSAWARRR